MTAAGQRVQAVRRFNRLYTRQIGLLQRGYLRSPFSLTEVRVLYELAHRGQATATALGKELGLDAGYLSRILVGFEKQKLIRRQPSETDGRQSHLRLTKQGQRTLAPLERSSNREVAAMLNRLSPAEQGHLIEAMGTIERLLDARPEPPVSYLLRPHRPGDIGWVIHRHGALYAQEYGWDERFEALVAEIAAKFIQNFDPKREACWIAEKDGEIAGSLFLAKGSENVAKLRLLLVEPSARGMGIGNRLVNECIRFARQAGYRKITLWTQSILHAAIAIYRKAGFRLVREESHHSFGYDLVGQTWELDL